MARHITHGRVANEKVAGSNPVLAAALAAHNVARKQLPADMQAFLLLVAVSPSRVADDWDRSFWAYRDEFLPGPEQVLDGDAFEEREEYRQGPFAVLPGSDAKTCKDILEALIWTVFGFSADPVVQDSLGEEERQVLEALVESSHAWPPSEALASALRQHGLPSTREGIRALLDG